jgi:hypothetical protein
MQYSTGGENLALSNNLIRATFWFDQLTNPLCMKFDTVLDHGQQATNFTKIMKKILIMLRFRYFSSFYAYHQIFMKIE